VLAYTWSRNLDLGASDGFAANAEDAYDLEREKGPTDFSLPHVLSFASVYELPFGKGRFQTNTPLDVLVGGWQLNGILQLTSGTPYSVNVCGDIANVGRFDCYERANPVGDPHVAHPSVFEWINPAAFTPPPQNTFGDLGRNTLRGDRFSNLDLSVFRNFTLEGLNLQFRAEGFNVLNHTTFGNPVSNLSDPNFGRIFVTRSVERQLQFALKLSF
jgi:hypothetical protein